MSIINNTPVDRLILFADIIEESPLTDKSDKFKQLHLMPITLRPSFYQNVAFDLLENAKNLSTPSLNHFEKVLKKRIELIKNNTNGIIGFFRHFFHLDVRAHLKEEVKYLEALRDFTVDIREVTNQQSKETPKVPPSKLAVSSSPNSSHKIQNKENTPKTPRTPKQIAWETNQPLQQLAEIIRVNAQQKNQAEQEATPPLETTHTIAVLDLPKQPALEETRLVTTEEDKSISSNSSNSTSTLAAQEQPAIVPSVVKAPPPPPPLPKTGIIGGNKTQKAFKGEPKEEPTIKSKLESLPLNIVEKQAAQIKSFIEHTKTALTPIRLDVNKNQQLQEALDPRQDKLNIINQKIAKIKLKLANINNLDAKFTKKVKSGKKQILYLTEEKFNQVREHLLKQGKILSDKLNKNHAIQSLKSKLQKLKAKKTPIEKKLAKLNKEKDLLQKHQNADISFSDYTELLKSKDEMIAKWTRLLHAHEDILAGKTSSVKSIKNIHSIQTKSTETDSFSLIVPEWPIIKELLDDPDIQLALRVEKDFHDSVEVEIPESTQSI